MRFKLAPALFVSILLIGVASWARFTTSHRGSSNLIAVAQPAASVDNQDLIDSYLPQASIGNKAAISQPETITATDVIGRGLISDYVGLAANGQDTDAGINNLADKYVESISTLNQTDTISLTDIKVGTDSKASYQSYGDALIKIENDYRRKISVTAGGKDLNTLGSDLYHATSAMSAAYNDAASKLKVLSVPPLLVELHVKLVNNYLSTATAMKDLSQTEKDPTLSFSGITTLNKNAGDEDTILKQMAQILVTNGI